MKKYITTIILAAVLLLIFPFLGLPELWENIYVLILAFVIGSSAILLRHKSGLVLPDDEDDERSLQEYVEELRDRFQKHQPIQKDYSRQVSDNKTSHE